MSWARRMIFKLCGPTANPGADRTAARRRFKPAWSPDGRSIAYVAAATDEDTLNVWIIPSGGGAPRLASSQLDLKPDVTGSNIDWGRTARSLRFVAGVKGEQHLFGIDLATETVTAVTSGARYVSNVDAHLGSGVMVYAANDSRHISDLYMASLDGSGERRLTRLNAKLYGRLQLQDVERVRFKSVDEWDIDGFFLKPVGWQEGRKYPMVLSIHGGPANMYGVNWFHEAQVYASRGWAVFYANPRGSSGYGEKFKARRGTGVGRQSVSGPDERRGCHASQISVDRSRPAGRDGWQLWRLHD